MTQVEIVEKYYSLKQLLKSKSYTLTTFKGKFIVINNELKTILETDDLSKVDSICDMLFY